jgi:hypothetical protein
LFGLVPGGIVPVHVTVAVCPIVEGTVTLLVAGIAASTVLSVNPPVAPVMIAVTMTKAAAVTIIFICQLGAVVVVQGLSESCDITFLLQRRSCEFPA